MHADQPALHLTSHFYPSSPELPHACRPELSDELQMAAADIQSERYREAACRLADRCADDTALLVTAAECFLLADEPSAARELLSRQLLPDGDWALACARVQCHDLEGALDPLTSLNVLGRLDDQRRVAVGLLIDHLGQARVPNGLSELALSPDELVRARRDGCRRFVRRALQEIARSADDATTARVVERVEARSAGLAEPEAWSVLMPIYEAAVRATSDCGVAARALDRVLRRPDLLDSDDDGPSRALLFAATSDRLGELRTVLEAQARQRSEPARLAAGKLSLVQGDLDALLADSADAGLRRAGLGLVPEDAPRFSQWVARSLHPYLPAPVAERLEDRSGWFFAQLGRRAAVSEPARRAVERAAAHLERGIMYTEADPRGLREAMGRWAHEVAIAMLESRWEWQAEPAAYAEAARRLLGPEWRDEVVATLASALGYAYSHASDREQVAGSLDMVVGPLIAGATATSAFMHQVLTEWERWRREGRAARDELEDDMAAILRPVADPPVPERRLVPAEIGDLEAPSEVHQLIEECFGDRARLLPGVAPYRGRRWFASDVAHGHYQQGRTAKVPLDSFRAFEAAWLEEPNGAATTQGLIHGLRKRLREQPGRLHALERRAEILDQRFDREVEAALAWQTLADVAERDSPARRAHMGRAAAALRRGTYRRPWTRARNAEIAIELELGDYAGAGDAAWAEARLWLPGTDQSRRYSLLAASLWSWSRPADQPEDALTMEARARAGQAALTNREAVRYAVATGYLDALGSATLDPGSLEELWRACRGDEERLRRCLERQASSLVSPRPAYLDFLRRRQDPDRVHPTGGTRAGERRRLTELRLTAAELVTRDVVRELATPPAYLLHPDVRRFLAALRASTADDRTAYDRFSAKVEESLAALFELRDAVPVSQVEPYGGRLARARAAVFDALARGRVFADPAVALCAQIVGRHLQSGLDAPTKRDYLREKNMHLPPSRLGLRLGEWYAKMRSVSGSQDFFHHHEHYRYNGEPPAEWLRYHHVLGSPAGEAIRSLLDSLDLQIRQLAQIEGDYRDSRPGTGLRDFGLATPLRDAVAVLQRALAPDATRDELAAIEGTLQALGRSLRALDLARLDRTPGLLVQHALAEGRYLVPRGPDLLSHWRANVLGDHPTLRASFQVPDDADRKALCIMCLDERFTTTPESISLRGMAPFADVVEALGGQLHLWMSRSGQRSRCRLEGHRSGTGDEYGCAADEYVRRIEQRLRELSATQWYSERETVERWLQTLHRALHGQESVNLVFVVVPPLHEVGV